MISNLTGKWATITKALFMCERILYSVLFKHVYLCVVHNSTRTQYCQLSCSNCSSLVLAVWLFTVYAIYLMSLRLYAKVTLSFEKLQVEEQWPGSSTSGMPVTYLYVPIIYHTCCGQHSHWRAYRVCQMCQSHKKKKVSKCDILCYHLWCGVVCIFRLIR